MRSITCLLFLSASALTLAASSDVYAGDSRQWSDQSGKFSVEAELLTADKQLIVLQDKDGELIALRRDQLSDADQQFVLKHVGQNRSSSDLDVDSVWTLGDGEEIAGRLIGFGRQELIVKRERGKVWVNDRKLEELPKAYRKILPDVVSAIDRKQIASVGELEEHLAQLGAGPFKYTVAGVQLDLEERGKITIPLSLLAVGEAKDIQPGFERWQASQEKDVSDDDRYETESRERLALDSRQRQRQRDQSSGRPWRRMQMMELGLLAAEAGVTDVWQVAIRPVNRFGYGRTVVVSAQNSLIARQRVARKYPQWQIGAIVKRSF